MSTHPAPNTDNLQAYIKAQLAELPINVPVSSEADTSTTEKLHAAKLAEIARRVQTLPPVTDAETLDKNQKALTALTRMRTGLDKARKAMLEPFTAIKAQVDAYVGTNANSGLQGRIAEIEEPIRARIEAYKAEEERKRQEAQRIIDERNKARERAVLAAGMIWDGLCYKYGSMVLWPTDLRNYSEEQWSAWKQTLDQAVEAERIAVEEAKRKEAEKAAAMKAEDERLAKERAELEAMRAKMREDLNHLRQQQMDALVGDRCDFFLGEVEGLPLAAGGDLASWTEEQWAEVLRMVQAHLKAKDEATAESARQAVAEQAASPSIGRARCDYRSHGCTNEGRIVNGVWTCTNHIKADEARRTSFRKEYIEFFGAKQEGEFMVLDHLRVPMTDLRDMDVVHWDLVKAQFEAHDASKKKPTPEPEEAPKVEEARQPVVNYDRILRVLVPCMEVLPYCIIPAWEDGSSFVEGVAPLTAGVDRLKDEIAELVRDIETLQAHDIR